MITFDPHLNISNTDIIVVGLGGTGSALARHICRTLFEMRRNHMQTPSKIRFVDPDVVEEKNVGRQMFSFSDIGQYKAEILARRFNAALGLGIEWCSEPFSASQHTSTYGNNVILGCVDNHLARRELAKARGVWIDSGNDKNSGQVIIGNTSNVDEWERAVEQAAKSGSVSSQQFVEGIDLRSMKYTDATWRSLPNAALIFPQLLQPDPDAVPREETRSCADLIATGEQHLLVNDSMAGIVANYFHRLMYRQPITNHITFYDGELLTMKSVPISVETIRTYLDIAETV